MKALKNLLGIDPGREKVGLAIISRADGAVLWRQIAPRAEVEAVLLSLKLQWELERIALGHSTASGEIAALLRRIWPQMSVEVVDERDSTLEARGLYWEANPPRGWRKWLPLSLQSPPGALDDWAAVVIARRAGKRDV